MPAPCTSGINEELVGELPLFDEEGKLLVSEELFREVAFDSGGRPLISADGKLLPPEY